MVLGAHLYMLLEEKYTMRATTVSPTCILHGVVHLQQNFHMHRQENGVTEALS